MKAKHIQTGKVFELTGSCYFRDAEGFLFLSVSYLEGNETKTSFFPVNEETGEVVQSDYEIIE